MGDRLCSTLYSQFSINTRQRFHNLASNAGNRELPNLNPGLLSLDAVVKKTLRWVTGDRLIGLSVLITWAYLMTFI